MKIHIGGFCTFTLISILSLFGFAAQAGAQGKTHTASNETASAVTLTYDYSVLYSFCSAANCADGNIPLAGLIQDSAGNLYGTTVGGGNSNPDCVYSDLYGCGTVFKVDSSGHETVLYSFCSAANCADGANPQAGLIQDSAGNLYGTTPYGGANGYGTVFQVDNTGHETVLYSFCSRGGARCTDGTLPIAGLIEDSAGNLYGTTLGGGAHNDGTVFKLDNTGHETVLYNFCSDGGANCTDGYGPQGLIQDAEGNLYGTTTYGGVTAVNPNGGGTAFKLDATGHLTVLYSFCSAANCADGNTPYAGLIQDAAGNLYGTTGGGGATNAGAVFKVDTTGHESALYSFCPQGGSFCTDGIGPRAGLIEDAAGNLYGTTGKGGQNGVGTVFGLDTAGNETILYSFCPTLGGHLGNCADGAYPLAGLVEDAAGNLYGTASYGGANSAANGGDGGGTVFKLSPEANVALTSSPNPSYVQQSVTFSVTVSGSISGPTPTGSVTFKEGTTALGTVTLADGQASFTAKFTKVGKTLIVASYSGDQNYKARNSTPLDQIVLKKNATSTAVVSSLNPSIYGQAVTLTATVSSAGPSPTGIVGFKNGTRSLGTASLSGGVALLTTSTLPAGTLAITAHYGGDAASNPSTSPALTQVVNQGASSTALVSSVDPSVVGKTVRFTATVTSPTSKPTGTVTFMDGSTMLGTKSVALPTGKAVYSTSTLSAGSHNITAIYGGTANVIGSTSPVLLQTVN